jgi:hypothetical protein
MEQHYFDCCCSDFGHVFRFLFDEKDGDLWLEVQLGPSRFRGFWSRVRLAFNYVFWRKQGYAGHYDTTMVRQEDIPRLQELLNSASQRPSEKPVLNG